jgi:hypothetical protein
MEERYIFKNNENISKEFLTKISTNFIITKVIITLNHIIEEVPAKQYIRIGDYYIELIMSSVNYFNNKIEYACAPYLSEDDLNLINNNLEKNNVYLKICKYQTPNNEITPSWNNNEWIECEVIIKKTENILIFDYYYYYYNQVNENKLIIESNIFNTYNEFKNYFLSDTKITEEQYKEYIIQNYYTLFVDNSSLTLCFINNTIDNKNIIIFNDNLDNL